MTDGKDTDNDPTPRHVAIIMDGRWAKARGAAIVGHHEDIGARDCGKLPRVRGEISDHLCIFTENWALIEVSGLMALKNIY